MSTLAFKRDLTRTTLAPPIKREIFGRRPHPGFATRELRLHRDAGTGEHVIRVADRLGGMDTGDDAEARFSLELDARREFRHLVEQIQAHGAWVRRTP